MEIGALYQQKTLGSIKCSFASSSTLAKQIEQGAPADIFLSANTKWMDFLEVKSLMARDTKIDLLRNSITLIVPKDIPVKSFEIKESADKRRAGGAGSCGAGRSAPRPRV